MNQWDLERLMVWQYDQVAPKTLLSWLDLASVEVRAELAGLVPLRSPAFTLLVQDPDPQVRAAILDREDLSFTARNRLLVNESSAQVLASAARRELSRATVARLAADDRATVKSALITFSEYNNVRKYPKVCAELMIWSLSRKRMSANERESMLIFGCNLPDGAKTPTVAEAIIRNGSTETLATLLPNHPTWTDLWLRAIEAAGDDPAKRKLVVKAADQSKTWWVREGLPDAVRYQLSLWEEAAYVKLAQPWTDLSVKEKMRLLGQSQVDSFALARSICQSTTDIEVLSKGMLTKLASGTVRCDFEDVDWLEVVEEFVPDRPGLGLALVQAVLDTTFDRYARLRAVEVVANASPDEEVAKVADLLITSGMPDLGAALLASSWAEKDPKKVPLVLMVNGLHRSNEQWGDFLDQVAGLVAKHGPAAWDAARTMAPSWPGTTDQLLASLDEALTTGPASSQ